MKRKMTPAQLRAARRFTNLSVEELAHLADVSAGTINRFENEHGGMQPSTAAAIERALGASGVELTEDGGVKPKQQGELCDE